MHAKRSTKPYLKTKKRVNLIIKFIANKAGIPIIVLRQGLVLLKSAGCTFIIK